LSASARAVVEVRVSVAGTVGVGPADGGVVGLAARASRTAEVVGEATGAAGAAAGGGRSVLVREVAGGTVVAGVHRRPA
jgi:hypothetical protein